MKSLAALLTGMVLMYVLMRLGRWWRQNITHPKIRDLSGYEVAALMQAGAERRKREGTRRAAVPRVRAADRHDSEPPHRKVDPAGA
jgi:hypothetical protein